MTLKWKPLRTLLRCHWLGRFAKPTYPVSFLRTMFMSLAAAAAALGSLDEMVWGAEARALATPFICSRRGDPAVVAGGDGDARVGAAGEAPLEAVSASADVNDKDCCAAVGQRHRRLSSLHRDGRMQLQRQLYTKRWSAAPRRGTMAGTNIGSGAPYPWRMMDLGHSEKPVKRETSAHTSSRSAKALPMLDGADC